MLIRVNHNNWFVKERVIAVSFSDEVVNENGAKPPTQMLYIVLQLDTGMRWAVSDPAYADPIARAFGIADVWKQAKTDFENSRTIEVKSSGILTPKAEAITVLTP